MQNNNLKKRVLNLCMEKYYEISKYDEAILELYQRYVMLNNVNKDFELDTAKKNFLKYLVDTPQEQFFVSVRQSENYIWGLVPDKAKSTKILNAICDNKELYFVEDPFLRSIFGSANIIPDEQNFYKYSCGFIIDDLTNYFDATKPSRMELMLNSDFEITKAQLNRARKNIDRIINNKISKYNYQPIFEPKYGREGVPKILVIDQSYNDYSIIKGCANDATFKKMLNCAIDENPNADILIKTHPDAIGDTIKPKCYYQNVKQGGNIYRITEPINPISMIQYVDKVYVCSSLFGFEALMCEKEVHTFGIPFYSGWGLTIDNQKCKRRIKKRTLEEIFYIAYIYMPQYVNPITKEPCEIEEVIDYLIKYRQKYYDEVTLCKKSQ